MKPKYLIIVELLVILPIFLVACGKVKPITYNGTSYKYQHVTVPADNTPWISTGIEVEEGEKVLILVSGEVKLCSDANCSPLSANSLLYMKTGRHYPDELDIDYNYVFINSHYTGPLQFGVADTNGPVHYEIGKKRIDNKPYRNNSGAFELDIFVIKDEQKNNLPNIIEDIITQKPQDHSFIMASDGFLKHEGTSLKEQKQQQLVWRAFLRNSDASLLEQYQFSRQNLEHPKYWEMLAILEETFFLEFKDLFWETDPISVNERQEGRTTWVKEAKELSKNGFLPANSLLAEFYAIGYQRIDFKQAVKYTNTALSNDSYFSKYLIAKINYLGLGQTVNRETALNYINEFLPYLQKMEQSPLNYKKDSWQNTWQYNALGWLYGNGIIYPKNIKKALQYYQIAAKWDTQWRVIIWIY